MPGLLALLEIALPGEDRIGPAAHAVFVTPELLDAEGPGPVVVAEEGHRHGAPFLFICLSEKQFGDDRVIPVGEDTGLDGPPLPPAALVPIAPPLNLSPPRS